mgnify:CR=1 FL=1
MGEAFQELLAAGGPEEAELLLRHLQRLAGRAGVRTPAPLTTPYLNTIPPAQEPAYPGDERLEARLEALSRWNAMAMVVRANTQEPGLGGHLSTYASAATLFEVGWNHFFRGGDHEDGPDQVYFQGHASPGVYARAFLEGRLDEARLDRFRRELAGGLPSYPHPWLLPRLWQFPSVSMGLAPLLAIYQARFNRYLEARGLLTRSGRVWAFLGDGEMDEPESTGALSVAARERLGNLVFVISCNLQRLDGPVRGNGQIVQELEATFRGAGWRVIKVLWGRAWDALFARDRDGRLLARLEQVLDGDLQRWTAEGAGALREELFGADPELARLVEDLSDEDLLGLGRGGHDRRKLYAGYRAALDEADRPSVVLALTVKGHLLGPGVEARNATHKSKLMQPEALRGLRDRLGLPLADEQAEAAAFVRPDADEMRYLRARREALGGPVPVPPREAAPVEVPEAPFARACEGSGEREVTTTVALVRLLSELLKDPQLGPRLVPIVPDEARTFGVEALFPQVGIYAPGGQRYRPVDHGSLLAYRERADGQLLQEGISEAGGASSFLAAGTAARTHGLHMVPWFFFYSMFGFQRVGDLLWAAGDARARGFLVGATAGRTTLNGEGLQHQDGHSQLLALSHPTVRAWDPAFAYELAVIVEDGLRRMVGGEGQDAIDYLTVANEPYRHPPLPAEAGVREAILRGMYRLRPPRSGSPQRPVQLLASGTLVQAALAAQRLLEAWDVAACVWSVTSWKALQEDGLTVERWNLLHPEREPRVGWLRQCLGEDDPGAVVGVSDWIKALPAALSHQLPVQVMALGTDGFGRSDTRAALRGFFEVDPRWVTLAALTGLARRGRVAWEEVVAARDALGIDPRKPDPRGA